VPEIPDKLAAVVERLMQKAPEARYSGADEVVEELSPLAGDLPAPIVTGNTNSSNAAISLDSTSSPRKSTPPQRSSGSNPLLLPTPPSYPPTYGSNASAPHAPPAGTYPAATPPSAAAVNLPQNLKIPTRQSLRPDSANGEQGFAMPPGFVEELRTRRTFSPLAFAAIGISVMVLSYMALLAFNPFK
jgi:hypothetical protein